MTSASHEPRGATIAGPIGDHGGRLMRLATYASVAVALGLIAVKIVAYVLTDSVSMLSTLIDSLLPSKNYFYAIRIHGTFSAMMTRAIPMQFLPYPPLAQLSFYVLILALLIVLF